MTTTTTTKTPAANADRVTLAEVAGWISDADARATDPDLRRMASLASATALTAQERATWDRVVVCEAAMPEGAVILHRKLDNQGVQHVITWDPAQTSRETVDGFLRMFTGECIEYTPDVYQALRGIAEYRRGDYRPETIEFWDLVEQTVIGAADPFAAVACISRTITREHAALQAAR
jgi:hypothetical protein